MDDEPVYLTCILWCTKGRHPDIM